MKKHILLTIALLIILSSFATVIYAKPSDITIDAVVPSNVEAFVVLNTDPSIEQKIQVLQKRYRTGEALWGHDGKGVIVSIIQDMKNRFSCDIDSSEFKKQMGSQLGIGLWEKEIFYVYENTASIACQEANVVKQDDVSIILSKNINETKFMEAQKSSLAKDSLWRSYVGKNHIVTYYTQGKVYGSAWLNGAHIKSQAETKANITCATCTAYRLVDKENILASLSIPISLFNFTGGQANILLGEQGYGKYSFFTKEGLSQQELSVWTSDQKTLNTFIDLVGDKVPQMPVSVLDKKDTGLYSDEKWEQERQKITAVDTTLEGYAYLNTQKVREVAGENFSNIILTTVISSTNYLEVSLTKNNELNVDILLNE